MAGNNLFAYCNNRPVNDIDNDGTRCTEFDDGTGRWEYVDSTGFMHQGSGTKPITQKTSVKSKVLNRQQQPRKPATAKNTGARDDFSTAGLVMTIQKTAITSIGALANLGKTGSRILGAYGYVFSTPFAIFSHFYDPYLTTNQKWGLSLLEVGLAVGGIILAPALVGVSGALLGVGVAMLSYAISTGATDLCYNYNDRRREGE